MGVDFVELGKRMKARRKKLGLKQAQLAEKVGITDKFVSDIETAKKAPSLETFLEICNALQTTPDNLLFGEERTDLAVSLKRKINLIQQPGNLDLLSEITDIIVTRENKSSSC